MITDIFYNEIVPECALKKLVIDDAIPAISFDTIIENKGNYNNNNSNPTLIINDKKRFDIVLEAYVMQGIKFYYSNELTHDNIKSLIAYVFSNATAMDLCNPVHFLSYRKSLIDNIDDNYIVNKNILGYDATIEVNKLKPFLEAPYSFKVTLKDDLEEYVLPEVIFGISKETGVTYVYAIQNKFKENTKVKKKVNRLLFKINGNYVDENSENYINGKDVSMPFVASLILFINYLKECNIEKISVPVNLLIRYNAHYESSNRRLKFYEKKYKKEEFEEYKKNMELSNASYDDNSIMKLIRTFYRVSDQGNVLNITNYPFVTNDNMRLSINYDGTFDNEFCNQLFDSNTMKK